mmetsp:Transcript_9401/g.21375  ORF Transcript_9401/g.21375 Transcript_9401/m.21375 type:complete len:139 (+) Transcript_9401:87-503(+)
MAPRQQQPGVRGRRVRRSTCALACSLAAAAFLVTPFSFIEGGHTPLNLPEAKVEGAADDGLQNTDIKLYSGSVFLTACSELAKSAHAHQPHAAALSLAFGLALGGAGISALMSSRRAVRRVRLPAADVGLEQGKHEMP